MTTARPISENARSEIELRAYHIWEREGRPHGREREHWLIAETEILAVKPGRKTARTDPNGSGKTNTARSTAAANAVSKSRKGASKAAPAEKAKKSTKGKSGKSA